MELFLNEFLLVFTITRYKFLNSFPILNYPKTPVKSMLNVLLNVFFGGWLIKYKGQLEVICEKAAIILLHL
jgi:hypothetical protein